MSGAASGVPVGPDVPCGQGDDAAGAPPVRLKTRPDFVRAATGGRVHARCFSLQVFRRPVESPPVPGPRVGLTVTRKVGGAVERNRIKRRLREALKAPGLALQPDHDYVVVARVDALTARFPKLVAELRRSFDDATSGRSRRSGPRRDAKRHQPATAP